MDMEVENIKYVHVIYIICLYLKLKYVRFKYGVTMFSYYSDELLMHC